MALGIRNGEEPMTDLTERIQQSLALPMNRNYIDELDDQHRLILEALLELLNPSEPAVLARHRTQTQGSTMTDQRCVICWEPDRALYWWDEEKICQWCFDSKEPGLDAEVDGTLAWPEDDS